MATAIFDAGPQGPVKVSLVDRWYDEFFACWWVGVIVIHSNSPAYPKGATLDVRPRSLWNSHQFTGKFGTQSIWEGHPDWKSLPVNPAPHVEEL